MKKNLFTSILFVSLLSYVATAQVVVPVGFTKTDISSGWVSPVGSAFSSDGQKLFVWEKRGRVYVCNRDASGNYNKQATVVLNISGEVGDWRDHGMLGFALDPNFNINGLVYLLYNVDRHHLMNFGTASYNASTNDYNKATIGRVTRYKLVTSNGNLVADNNSRTILIGETRQTGIPLLYESHGVGSLAFAADGMLLVTTGDGASYSVADSGSIAHTYFIQALADGIIRPEENVGAFRSQMLNSLDGKLLRIDPTNGNGVGSNPFFDPAQPRSAKSRVWATGLRNPFRMTIKPGTGSTNPSTGDIGEVYIGDVGWSGWEELTVVDRPGMNCGWPIFEGHTVMTAYNNLATLNLDEPNPLFNVNGCTKQYFMFKELIKQATADNIKTIYNPCNATAAIGTNERFFHRRPMIDWQHGSDNARVGKFSGNNATTAKVGDAGSNVTGSPFRGNAAVAGCWYTGTSFPPKYRNTFFQADYGGSWLKSFTVNFTDVLQKVENFGSGFGAIVSIVQNPLDGSLFCLDLGDNTVKRIGYGGNQAPVAVMSSDKKYGPAVLNVSFTGNTSYDVGGSIASYSWDFGDGSPVSTVANPVHDFPNTVPANQPKKYVTKLTVTDNGGATSTDSIIISVNNTPPTVTITSPIKNSTYKIGVDTIYSCLASVVDGEHTDGQLTYEWQTFLRHNNHQHPEAIDNSHLTQTPISRIGCNGDDYYWLIKLTVTDAAGLAASDSSKIFPACTANSPLPLVLRSFSVTADDVENLVKWTTELEENIEYFEIERSTDGITFYPIHRQAARNITGTSTYGFVDNTFSYGVTYYRLKIVEKNVPVRYSMIIKTTLNNDNNKLKIVPVPVVNEFSVSFMAAQRGNVTIQIIDASGRTVQTTRENVSNGNNVIYMRNVSGLQPGTYFITVQQGANKKTGTFIKM